MAELSAGLKKLLESKTIAHVVTLMRDGSPQVTPVWVDHDGTHVLINTAEGRQKPRNIARDPRVALSLTGAENLYQWAAIRGKVVEVTRDGAWDHICKLSEKYTGNPVYGDSSGVRIIIKILPEHISSRGID